MRARQQPTFGSELRRLRLGADKTLADIAEVMGVSIPYVSDIERDRRNPPSRRVVAVIVEELGCPEELNRMCQLAMQFRGSIQLSPQTEEQRAVLVALERELEEGNLTKDAAAQVLRILNRSGAKK